jgi:trimethylamine--corrinoid protein Co-methyltransferase
MELLSTDEIEAIHQASLVVLKEIGMRVLLPEARQILHQGGVDIDDSSEMARFDAELIETALVSVPSEFTLTHATQTIMSSLAAAM